MHDEPKPEQKEKPSEGTKRSGTLQEGKESEGPTNLGDARKEAVVSYRWRGVGFTEGS